MRVKRGRPRKHKAILSAAEVAEEYSISPQTVYNWVKRGAPTVSAEPFTFDATALKVWIQADRVVAAQREGPQGAPLGVPHFRTSVEVREDTAKAKLRKLNAEAELREIILKKERGELLEATEVEAGRLARVAFLRGLVLGMPDALAPDLVGRDVPEIAQRLSAWVTGFLTEVSQ